MPEQPTQQQPTWKTSFTDDKKLEFSSYFGEEGPYSVLTVPKEFKDEKEAMKYAKRVEDHMKANNGQFPNLMSQEWA